MKSLMFLVLILIPIPGLAQEKADKEPAALAEARRVYEAKLKAVVEPLTTAYVKKLDQMKRQYGSKGDLASANAVQGEIAGLTGANAGGEAIRMGASGGFVGTTWQYRGRADSPITYREGGIATCPIWHGQGKWKAVDQSTIIQEEPGGNRIRVTFTTDRQATLWEYLNNSDVQYAIRAK
jgi:hypothetical protein